MKGARSVDCPIWLCPKLFVLNVILTFIFEESRNKVNNAWRLLLLLLPMRVHSSVVKLELESSGRICVRLAAQNGWLSCVALILSLL